MGLNSEPGPVTGRARDFQDRVVVITGASSGIGWALAKEFASQGAAVGLVARRADRLGQLCDEIRSSGGRAVHAAADVRERHATIKAIQSLERQLGSVDVLVANAGVGTTNTVEVSLCVPFRIADTFHRDIVIDNHGHRLNIDAASEDIGGNKDFGLTRAECVNDAVTVCTFLGSGQIYNLVAFFCHTFLNSLGALSRL